MAKGQKRSNKEIKKPKQDKAKAKPEASSLTSRAAGRSGQGRKEVERRRRRGDVAKRTPVDRPAGPVNAPLTHCLN